jgi:short-subunit dehydrogenase
MVKRFLADPSVTVHATTRNGRIAHELGEDESRRLHVYALDLTHSDGVEKLAAELKSKNIEIEILINNAGFGLFGALEDLSEEQIRRQMEVNFFGVVMLTRALLPQLRRTAGHIINLSSAFGFTGFPMTSLYCASKFAIEGWSESMLHELKPFEVKVSVIQPGAHRTRFGANVNWGENSFSSQSAYYRFSKGYERLLEKMKSRKTSAVPETVAEGIYQLTMSNRPAFRVRFGKDAKFSYLTRRLFPSGLLLNMSSRLIFKMFGETARA